MTGSRGAGNKGVHARDFRSDSCQTCYHWAIEAGTTLQNVHETYVYHDDFVRLSNHHKNYSLEATDLGDGTSSDVYTDNMDASSAYEWILSPK